MDRSSGFEYNAHVMKQYELMNIYKVELGDQKAKELSQKVQELVVSTGGKLLKAEFWGKKRFAYPLKHGNEGYYEVMSFEAEPEALLKFKSKLKLLTDILRYLITA